MKTFYKRFDFLLNWFFIGTSVFFVLVVILLYLIQNTYNLENLLTGGNIVIINIIFFINFVFGALYFVSGILYLIIGQIKKKKETLFFGKKILLRGLLRIVIIVIVFFLFSLSASFFGLTLSDSPLPTITTNTTN